MNIIIYSTKAYEIGPLNQANYIHQQQLTFVPEILSERTASMAEGHDAVCIFVDDHANREVLENLQRLGVKYLLLRCAGFNNVDMPEAKKLGFKVARVPAYSPYAVAEHAVALLQTLNRKTHKAYNRIREGNFSLDGLQGFDLYGKTVGVIGAGKIGLCFINIMLGFGCNVIVFDPKPGKEIQTLPVSLVSLEQLYQSSDIISLHCPLNDTSKHLIDSKAISQMKPGVLLINTSRGAIIDTVAVIDGIKKNRIGGLAIDVYEEEDQLFFADHSAQIIQDDVFARLMTFSNVLITGHQAFLTHEALKNIAETTLQNASQLAKDDTCYNLVE